MPNNNFFSFSLLSAKIFIIPVDQLFSLLPQPSKADRRGKALETLSATLGISRDEVIAVSDSDNDISMVSWAGLGAAVQNATAALTKVAKYVVSAPTYRGVDEIIDKFIL